MSRGSLIYRQRCFPGNKAISDLFPNMWRTLFHIILGVFKEKTAKTPIIVGLMGKSGAH